MKACPSPALPNALNTAISDSYCLEKPVILISTPEILKPKPWTMTK
jgi:hypothetical protein